MKKKIKTNEINCEVGESIQGNAHSFFYKMLFFIFAFAAMGVILLLPEPSVINTGEKSLALSLAGKTTIAVLVMSVILWISEAIPFPVTGLLAISMLVITKATPFKELVKDGFGNPIFLFFVGVLILSAAISKTTILKRVVAFVLRHIGHSPKLIVLAFLIVGALLSGWITDMAVAAILMPIAVTILENANIKPLKSNFGRALLIASAWGPLIGGISTPAGCGPNPLTIGFLKDLAGLDFSFIQWIALGFPAMIMMIPAAWIILIKVFPLEKIDISISEEELKKQKEEFGHLTKKEILTVVIFSITIIMWITAPMIKKWTGGIINYLSISYVAITASIFFFLPGINILTWEEAEEKISWGGIILIVTGLSLGMSIYKTGAAEWIAWISFHLIGSLHPAVIIFSIVLGVSLLKVMFSSNTVTGIIVVPLLIALAKSLHIDPVLLAIPAGITSSLAFILVTSTPTNIIPYSAGYFTMGDMVKAGLIMTIVSSVLVAVSVYFMGGFLGIISL